MAKILRQLPDPLVYLLLAAVAVSLLTGPAELLLGVWAVVRSRERSLLTFVTLVGLWIIVNGAKMFAAFIVRDAGTRVERMMIEAPAPTLRDVLAVNWRWSPLEWGVQQLEPQQNR